MHIQQVNNITYGSLRAQPAVIHVMAAVEIAQGKPLGASALVAGVFLPGVPGFERLITVAYHFARERWVLSTEYPLQEKPEYLPCDDLAGAIDAFEELVGVFFPGIRIIDHGMGPRLTRNGVQAGASRG